MDALQQIISPDFLLLNSLYTGVLVGFICPVVGVFLVMRRLVFLGVALPQISSTGVAFALSAPLWLGMDFAQHSDHGASGMHLLAYLGSLIFSLCAILVLAFLERRGRGQPEGRLGVAYVVSASLSILLLAKNPYGEIGLLELLKGDIVVVSLFDSRLTTVVFTVVLGSILLFFKELLLVSFDRIMAVTLKINVVLWDVLLYVLIGLTVSTAVMVAGPMMTFGFLLIPAMTAHLLAGNMRRLVMAASSIGGISALVGFVVAYEQDLPVGPTDVVLLGVVYAVVWLIVKLRQSRSRRTI